MSNIDQFESRELKFSVSISDKTVINFLKQPGTEVIGEAMLISTLITAKASVYDSRLGGPTTPQGSELMGVAYFCYNPRPKHIAGLSSGGSALRGQKAGDENRIDIQFGCWFPIGMKVQEYTLNIRLYVSPHKATINSGGVAGLENCQVFLFGNYPESTRPAWFRDGYSPSPCGRSNTLVQTIPEMPVINVVRTAPRISPESLTFNVENLIETTEKLNVNIETVYEAYQNYKALIEDIENKLSALITRSSNLEGENLESKYATSIQELSKQLKSNQSNVLDLETQLEYHFRWWNRDYQIYENFPTIKPGSPDTDVRLKYLYGLDFEVVSKPEVLIAQYPDFKLMKADFSAWLSAADPTPYLRFIVKSKTAILRAHIVIDGVNPYFAENVILPGGAGGAGLWATDFYGGVVLVESQQWDGSMFLTSLLIGPKNYPFDLKILNSVECSRGWFEDAAGNLSDYWNIPPTSDCIPKATQAASAAKDFDNLKQVYLNLARANENFQNLSLIPTSLQNKLSFLPLISSDADLIKSKMDLLDLQITKERAAQAKVTAKKKTTITCIKGKLTNKVTAVKPKCPAGYKKK